MTDREAIARMRELDAKATPGPWEHFRSTISPEHFYVSTYRFAIFKSEVGATRTADAALIVALRNDALRIITQQEAEIERFKSQRDFLANELREAQAALENRNDR